LDMKAMQEMIKACIIPFKTDQEILDEVARKLGICRCYESGADDSDIEAKEQENELLRKQAEEAQQRAYLAALKADSADQRASAAYQSIEQLAQDNARGEDNNESASGEDEEGEEGEQHSSDGDYSSESDGEAELGLPDDVVPQNRQSQLEVPELEHAVK
ncbi:hypothetical protein Tco_0091804, partial [Tanacetum coccineum]